jgi:hypothetical protein
MNLKKYLLTLIGVGLLLPSGAGAEVWAASGFEDSPANSDAASGGAGKIRDTRGEVRQRLEVEHFFGDTAASEDDDNGLHRIGAARCYVQDAAPTGLFDSHSGIGLITDLADHNTSGSGEGTLANTATGAAGAAVEDDVGHARCWIDEDGADGNTNDECTGSATSAGSGSPTDSTPACCTAADTGTCDLDDNKMYVYLGVAGDGGTPPTGLVAGWQEVKTRPDGTGSGVRVKAGAPNILSNSDFDFNGCTGTTRPTAWSETGSPTFTYAGGGTTQGVGCNVLVTDVGGGDDIRQTLTNVKGGTTTYRVTAQVRETASDDICTLSTSGAGTEVTGMVSSGTAWVQLDGFFITSAATDTVTIILTNTAAGDICHWDHIGVYRQETIEVPQAGIIAVYDTYLTSDGADIEEAGVGYADVPSLSITIVPPTEGYVVSVRANISVGCDGSCNIGSGGGNNEGVICRLEVGGNEVAGTVRSFVAMDSTLDPGGQIIIDYINVIPIAGTSLVYTVGCKEVGANAMIFNLETADGDDTESSLSLIAFPPH